MRRSSLLAVLFLGMFVIGLDLFIVSPILHNIALTMAVAPARVGLLATAFALPYGTLALVFGPISDRIGRRPVLLAALPVFALASAATALAPIFTMLILARAVAGAAAAAITPGVYALVGDAFPPEARPKAMGIVLMGLNLGSVLGVPLGGWLALLTSWRGDFWLVTVLAVIAWLVLGPQLPAPTLKTNNKERHLAIYAQALSVPGAPSALATSGLWLGASFAFYAFVGELLYNRYHLGAGGAGLVLASFGVATSVGNLVAQAVVRRIGSPRRTAVLSVACTLSGVTIVAFGGNLPLIGMMLGMVLWAFGAGCGLPAHQTVLAGLGGRLRGTMLSLGSSSMYLGIMAFSAAQSEIWQWGGAPAAGALACAGMLLAILTESRIPAALPSIGSDISAESHLV